MTTELGRQGPPAGLVPTLRDIDAVAVLVHEHAARVTALADAIDRLMDGDMPTIAAPFDDCYAGQIASAGVLSRILGESAAVLDAQGTALEHISFALSRAQVQS